MQCWTCPKSYWSCSLLGRGLQPPPCDPQLLGDKAAIGNAVGECVIWFLATAGTPSPTRPAACTTGGPGSARNYPPGIAYVLGVVLHCDGQPVLCHPLPVQRVVYVDDAALPRKKGGNRYKGHEDRFSQVTSCQGKDARWHSWVPREGRAPGPGVPTLRIPASHPPGGIRCC